MEPSPTPSDGSAIVARFEGGVLTEAQVLRESQRLPPQLREKFETGPGRQSFVRSLVDKRLLVLEAERQGFTRDEDLRRQVRELEERLSIEALLAAEARKVAPPSEAEARAFYESHVDRFAEPERLRVARVLAAVPAGSSRSVWAQARQRAEGFHRRLSAKEAVEKVAAAGEGPERLRGGELGLLTRDALGDDAQQKAILALTKPGAVSPVVETRDGAAVLILLERRPARVPPFEEVRAAVLGQMKPGAQRKVLDQLLERLRAAGSVRLEERGSPDGGTSTRR
ncbi:peptidyl-prolyl cis-trans isomerase [Myxococcus stipitatus]|uniref:peptidyl-prolyl cis-trans isomerase n=1 Tax=Myxococcus stipitatus TaxID=83455 RepID=UPI001F2D2F56|nr:peptidyl-prolyl cis-trans isomerase [Myxococcus stipitatus]MCE9670036.1 peptidyl-prolyl cis-trans isomerase [Myxococcus stipitatus]